LHVHKISTPYIRIKHVTVSTYHRQYPHEEAELGLQIQSPMLDEQ
jgi:hypothetical protein